jgi:hypothetical protein
MDWMVIQTLGRTYSWKLTYKERVSKSLRLHLSYVKHLGPKGSGSSQIICLNLKEFEQVIVREHLWDLANRISGWVAQFLFVQVGSINGLSQSPARIISNSVK